MAFKVSIIGFAVLAFLGPVILFITAFFIYQRVKQHRESSKLSDIGGDDHHWHEDLKKKSDLSRLTNTSEVPLVVIEAKRGPARSYSNGSSSSAAAQSTESSTPASSTTTSSRSLRGCSPERSPQGSPRSPALLTPPPPAAVQAPGDFSVEPEALLLLQQQQQQQMQQQGDHCMLQMPVANSASSRSAAGQQQAPTVSH
jgi:hypothetical protein